jgi:hypothetical protein
VIRVTAGAVWIPLTLAGGALVLLVWSWLRPPPPPRRDDKS